MAVGWRAASTTAFPIVGSRGGSGAWNWMRMVGGWPPLVINRFSLKKHTTEKTYSKFAIKGGRVEGIEVKTPF